MKGARYTCHVKQPDECMEVVEQDDMAQHLVDAHRVDPSHYALMTAFTLNAASTARPRGKGKPEEPVEDATIPLIDPKDVG